MTSFVPVLGGLYLFKESIEEIAKINFTLPGVTLPYLGSMVKGWVGAAAAALLFPGNEISALFDMRKDSARNMNSDLNMQRQSALAAHPIEGPDNPFAFNTNDWEKRSPKLVWLQGTHDFNGAVVPWASFIRMNAARSNHDVKARVVSSLEDICDITATLETPTTMVIESHGSPGGVTLADDYDINTGDSIPKQCFKNIKKIILSSCNTAETGLSSFAAYFARKTGVPTCGAEQPLSNLLSIDDLKYTDGDGTYYMHCFDPETEPSTPSTSYLKLGIYGYLYFKGIIGCMKVMSNVFGNNIVGNGIDKLASSCNDAVDGTIKKTCMFVFNFLKKTGAAVLPQRFLNTATA